LTAKDPANPKDEERKVHFKIESLALEDFDIIPF